MKILITGVNGFVGKHLYRKFSDEGHLVYGVGREDRASSELNGLQGYQSIDLCRNTPDLFGVDVVVHLAGLASVGPSFNLPQEYINSNSSMITNLCEELIGQNFNGRLIIVSSGAIYSSDQPMPITEGSHIKMSSPYVVSKVLCENQAEYYRSRGLDIVVARPFNHIGPGQLPGFLVPDFAEKLRSLGDSSKILVGNLDTKRDYTDVRDVVRAYYLLSTTTKLNHNIYNICSGRSTSGKEILDKLSLIMNINNLTTVSDPSLIRPNDPVEIFGNYDVLRIDTGWNPEISLNETLKDYLA